MYELSYMYLVWIALVVVLALITIWSRKNVLVRTSSVMIAGILVVGLYVGGADILGKPKPVALEWFRQAKEAVVLEAVILEGEGLYLYLQVGNEPKPLSYVLPWDRRLAGELQDALRNGGRVIMRYPFEPSWDNGDLRFYELPQFAPEPKPEPPKAKEFAA